MAVCHTSTNTYAEFSYDAQQNRIGKRTFAGDVPGVCTFYVRDAQGNVLATYEHVPSSGLLRVTEHHIYGLGRLGVSVPPPRLAPRAGPRGRLAIHPPLRTDQPPRQRAVRGERPQAPGGAGRQCRATGSGSEAINLPLAFEVIAKTESYVDAKTGKTKKKSPKTKNELMRERLQVLCHHTNNLDYLVAEKQAAYVLRYFLKKGHESQDWAEVENLYMGEHTKAADRQIVGLRTSLKNNVGALTLLESLPIEEDEDQRFKEIMKINIALRQGGDGFQLSEAQEQQLHKIADVEYSIMSGYACALLSLCKGYTCEEALPDEALIGNMGDDRSTSVISTPTQVKVFPNPANGQLTVVFDTTMDNETRWEELWEHDLPRDQAAATAHDIQSTNDGGVVTSYVGYSDSDCKLTVDKFDQMGNLEWTTRLPQQYEDAQFTKISVHPDGGYLGVWIIDTSYLPVPGLNKFPHPPIVFKLDAMGNLEWQKTYATGQELRYYQIFSTHNGDIICCGMDNNYPEPAIDSSKYAGYIRRMTKDGVLLWERRLRDTREGGHYFALIDGLEMDNGDFVFTGSIDDGNLPPGKVWVIRVDSTGCFSPNCDYDEYLVSTLVPSNIETKRIFEVFPVPFSGLFSIASVLGSFVPAGQYRAAIFDMYGRMVHEKYINPNFISDFDAATLPAGMYNVSIFKDGVLVQTNKVVKQ